MVTQEGDTKLSTRKGWDYVGKWKNGSCLQEGGWQQQASNGKRTDHLDDWAEPKVSLTDGMAAGVVK